MKKVQWYILIIYLLNLLLYSCQNSDDTLLENSKSTITNNSKKLNSIQSITPPNNIDSILCTDTLIYLAITNFNDASNPIIAITENNVIFSTANGQRFYNLTFLYQDSTKKRISIDYWDYTNEHAFAAANSFYYVCEGGDCCAVGYKTEPSTGAQYHVCLCNGLEGLGSTVCTLKKYACNPADRNTGIIIFNQINTVTNYSITYF